MSAPPTDGDLLTRGATVGRYLILGQLGVGAMGVVYAAYDPDLDRKVALKLLRPEVAAERAGARQARLAREAKAIAKLSHPNVVGIFDVGVHDGRVFLAMEHLPGGTLRDWLAAERRGWRAVLARFIEVGRGLGAAHAEGLVHRDFKPDNVLLDKNEIPKIVDFGLVRLTAGEGGEALALPLAETIPPAAREAAGGDTLTRTGALTGTPAYMAPEQFLGRAGDARSDQFAFSVALYEGLYGERPFPGETIVTLAESVTSGRLRPAPDGADVPAWLRAVILRGLSTRPEKRFATLAEMVGALGVDPRARTRRGLALAGALVALLGVAAYLRQGRMPPVGPPPLCTGAPPGTARLTGPGALPAKPYGYAAPGIGEPVVAPLPPVADASPGVVVTFAPEKATAWGGFGLALAGCLDASAYTGVRFTVAGELGACALSFGVVPVEQQPKVFGGVCTGECIAPSSAPLPLGTSTVSFADLAGGAPEGPIDQTRLLSLQWALKTLGGQGTPCRAHLTVTDVTFVPDVHACGDDGLIDDGEDGDNRNLPRGGRGGYWYTFRDKAGTTVAPVAGEDGGTFAMSPGGHASKFAARFHGKVATGEPLFAGMGMNFVDPKGPYDASRYAGIAFVARRAPGSTGKVRLKIPDVNTDPDGSVCAECFNDFGADLTLGPEWKPFVFPWSALKQMPGWGVPRRSQITPQQLFGIQFQVNVPGAAYDVFVDDLKFVCSAGPGQAPPAPPAQR
jgi:serine/threonine protein kinase